jgi:integrase
MVTTEQLLRVNRLRRFRTQKGTLIERRDGFFLRYYIDASGGQRRKVTERLCDLGTKRTVIEIKMKHRMLDINGAQKEGNRTVAIAEQTIGDYWRESYLPWCEANLAKSTVRGYKKLWDLLESRVGNRSLQKFRRVDASDFLTALVEGGWNRNSVKHAKFLLSGLFARAVSRDVVEGNPMTDAKSDIPAPAPKPRAAYTNAETVAVLKALNRPDAKLLWSLCTILGTRPSEAAGLRWECCTDERIMIERAAPYGVPQEVTKSERGKRSLVLDEPVKSLLAAWKATCGDPETGWLFPRPNGEPIDHSVFVRSWVEPEAKKAIGARYAGLYPGRHGTGTQLAIHTGDAGASHQALGNSREVAERNYVHPVQEAGDTGLRLRYKAIRDEIEKSGSL